MVGFRSRWSSKAQLRNTAELCPRDTVHDDRTDCHPMATNLCVVDAYDRYATTKKILVGAMHRRSFRGSFDCQAEPFKQKQTESRVVNSLLLHMFRQMLSWCAMALIHMKARYRNASRASALPSAMTARLSCSGRSKKTARTCASVFGFSTNASMIKFRWAALPAWRN